MLPGKRIIEIIKEWSNQRCEEEEYLLHDQDCSIIVLMMIMPRTILLAHLDDHPDCTMFHDCTDDDHAKGHNNARNDDYPDCTMFHECSDDDDAKDRLAGPQ